jgi:predicted phosphodiesterase
VSGSPWRSRRWPGAIVLACIAAVTLAAQDVTLPDKPDSVKFAVMGDMGTGEPAQFEVAKEMLEYHAKFPFTFVILVGDNVYGSQNLAKKFEQPYQGLLDAKVQFYASLGNHDDQNERFYKNFNMNGDRYYTFKKGNARFFALDSNYMDKDQVAWLEKQLAASGSDWKIAFFHHPLYSTGGTHGPSLDLRAVLEPIFVKYDVSVVFAGHEHFYERIKPQHGIEYFISGAGGQLRPGDIHRQDPMAVGFDQDRSFMLAEIVGNEMSFQAVSRTGKTVDKGTIVQLNTHPGSDVVTTPPGKAPGSQPSKAAPPQASPIPTSGVGAAPGPQGASKP